MNILALCLWTRFSLPIHQLGDIWTVSASWFLWMEQQWTWGGGRISGVRYRAFGGICLSSTTGSMSSFPRRSYSDFQSGFISLYSDQQWINVPPSSHPCHLFLSHYYWSRMICQNNFNFEFPWSLRMFHVKKQNLSVLDGGGPHEVIL